MGSEVTGDARRARYSFWLETAGEDLAQRASLPGDTTVDVAIAGAGFAGLWTAYYLAKADPSLRIAVLEREIAGFGASGRNGGWCTATFSVDGPGVASRYGRHAALALQRAMFDSVDEVGRVCAAEGIDAHYAKGGTTTIATSRPGADRLRTGVEASRAWGWGPQDLTWLEPGEVRDRIAADRCLGGTYTPHCAALHPARLARGLARAVERLGVRIFEGTTVRQISGRRIDTDHGVVRCEVAVRCLEAYTASMPGQDRLLLPLHIYMIATEPLPSTFWDAIGWRHRETLADPSYSFLYAQRTADGRIAVGGKHAGYAYGSKVDDAPRGDALTERRILATLRSLFPRLPDGCVSHRWGGFIGIPRDWFGSAGYDPGTGFAWAGGYVGDGVSESNLGGRALADLILRRDTQVARLPFVNHVWPGWEREPIRWLGVSLANRLMVAADRMESWTSRPSPIAGLATRLMGR
jgi:glycine/D-amino acid oxidase-like deaminating enzyme